MYEDVLNHIKSVSSLEVISTTDSEQKQYEKAGFLKVLKVSNDRGQKLTISFNSEEVMYSFADDKGFLLDGQKSLEKQKQLISAFAASGVITENNKTHYSLVNNNGERLISW